MAEEYESESYEPAGFFNPNIKPGNLVLLSHGNTLARKGSQLRMAKEKRYTWNIIRNTNDQAMIFCENRILGLYSKRYYIANDYKKGPRLVSERRAQKTTRWFGSEHDCRTFKLVKHYNDIILRNLASGNFLAETENGQIVLLSDEKNALSFVVESK